MKKRIFCLLFLLLFSFFLNSSFFVSRAAVIPSLDSYTTIQSDEFFQRVGFFTPYSSDFDVLLQFKGEFTFSCTYIGSDAAVLANSIRSNGWHWVSLQTPIVFNDIVLQTQINPYEIVSSSSSSVVVKCYTTFSFFTSDLAFDLSLSSSACVGDGDYYTLSIISPTFSFFEGQKYWNCEINSVYSGTYLDSTFVISPSSVFFPSVGQIYSSFSCGFAGEDLYNTYNSTNISYKLNGTSLFSESFNYSASSFRFATLSFLTDFSNYTFSSSTYASNFSANSDYGLRFRWYATGFNLYPFDDSSVVSGVSIGSPDYQSCTWYDIPCHLGNAFTYLIYKFPLTKGFIELLSGAYNFITETFGFLALWSGIGVVFSVLMTFIVLRIIRYFTS